ncbi:hypothetical protein LOAG_14234 [Loa loa]|uniref:SEFIR domain-containing protein n=2 Tax=Loa loa TaxID=7209 RepID=A0A1I7VSW6_LOALO|nr:hypothetical protein LOAG_14234 [Loa loa]EFO14288.1 hypothetical protein LOAG_14234 [Loa loa]
MESMYDHEMHLRYERLPESLKILRTVSQNAVTLFLDVILINPKHFQKILQNYLDINGLCDVSVCIVCMGHPQIPHPSSNTSSWWYGPYKLKGEENEWLQCEFQAGEQHDDEGTERNQWIDANLITQIAKRQQFSFIDASRFSKWSKLIK